MSYVILVRNAQRGGVFGVTDPDKPECLAQYDTESEAEQAALNTTVCKAWPYSIVEAP